MTLTEISYYSRKYLPFFIIFCLFIVVFFYIIKLLFIYVQSQPQQKTMINPIFGSIKRPLLKEGSTSANFKYILDTIEGQPVTASETAKIFPLPPSYSKIKFLQQIYLMAKAVGFDTETVKHSLVGTDAIFDDGSQKMTIDVSNFNFVYEYNIKGLDENEFSTPDSFPTQREIEDKAINFLNAVGRYPEELAVGKRNLIYVTYVPGSNELRPAPQNKTTNFVEVDLYRSDIDEIPIVSPKYFNSQNYVMIAFGKDSFRVIKAQVQFFEKSPDQYGVYPLKSGDTAWEELKAGKALVVSATQGIGTINIKKMFLGYFDPDIYQEYLQPVYVFLGDNNFVGYVPAIDNKYLSD